ncbi:MAG: glycosyltransferase family 39 protein [Deltaproteobacteria bacterium]|nr:glycosyltransferase family 39 protein [Deltaproteobacteria bacterium]
MEEINQKKHIFNLFILIFLAFLIRFLVLQHASLISPDGTHYVTIAKNLISKGQFISDGSHFPDIIQPPLYPGILSIFIPLFNEPEFAGRVVSAAFGSLLIIPFFFLGIKVFCRKVAYIGSVLIAIYPILIESSITPLSESLYIFFVFTAILCGWIALERWEWKYSAIAGGLFGLSYLTRVEGIAYIISFFLISVLFSILKKRGLRGFLVATSAVIGFLFLVSPYHVYVWNKVGTFFTVPKINLILTHRAISRNLISTMSSEGMNKEQMAEMVFFGLTDDSSELLANSLFFKGSVSLKDGADKTDKFKRSPMPYSVFFKIASSNIWRTYKRVYQRAIVLPPGLLIFLIIGFFNDFWTYPNWKKNLYLFMMFLSGHIFVLSHVDSRFILSSVPIMVLWQSIGILKADEWLKRTLESYRSIRPNLPFGVISRIFLASFLALSILPFTYTVFKQSSSIDDSLKKAGLWMRENISPDSKVMASRPQAAFYGGMKYLTLPYAEFKDILKYAEVNCGDYLLLYKDKDMELRPRLKPLMRDDFIDSALRLIKKMETPRGGSIYLYEFASKGDGHHCNEYIP